MKNTLLCLLLGATATSVVAQSDPRITSWYTAPSGQYARIYPTREAEQAGTSQTTWSNGTYSQNQPAYAGVLNVAYSTDFVYVRSAGLALGHIMGPWYNDTGPGGTEEVFQNWPEAIYATYRFPRTPSIPTTRTAFPPGAIGLMVDGTVIFSSSDTFSWDNNEDGTGTGQDTGPGAQAGGLGDGIWSHDAYITESNTFDKSNAHCAGNQLHYHAVPMKLRHALGDSVQAVKQANGEYLYSENFNGNHSPIIGWMNDGYPLYGPYGYSSPMDPNSGVRRMVTGFTIRNGQNGTYDLTTNGRNKLPAWAVTYQGIGPDLNINQQGPSHASIPVPYYMEDYAFKGDLPAFSYYDGTGAFSESTHYDMNQWNVRFCVTPEFPNGTWAYFTCIDASGAPTFPYNVTVQYYGDPSQGGAQATVTEALTTNWVGGADAPLNVNAPNLNGGTVTLTWSGVDGGTYAIESNTDLGNAADWAAVNSGVTTNTITDTTGDTARFYRVTRTALAAFDETGSTTNTGDTGGTGGGGTGGGTGPSISNVNPASADEGATVSVSITLTGDMLPPTDATPSAVTIGTVSGTSITYNGTTVTASFTFPAGTTGTQNVAVSFPAPPDQQQGLDLTATGAFTIGTTGGGGTGGTGNPPTIGNISPSSGEEGATVSVSITLTGDMLPPGDATPSAVTIGNVAGTAISYNGSVVSASFTLPTGTTGAKNVSVTFPTPTDPLVITQTGGFTINAAAGGGGGSGATGGNGILSVSPNSGTRGAQVTLTINMDPSAQPMLPPDNAPQPPTVTVGGATASSVTYSGTTVTATVTIPAGATTGAAEIIVSFPPPPGMADGPSYNLTGGFTIN